MNYHSYKSTDYHCDHCRKWAVHHASAGVLAVVPTHRQPKLWGDCDMHTSHNLIYYAELDFERNLALGLISKDLRPFEWATLCLNGSQSFLPAPIFYNGRESFEREQVKQAEIATVTRKYTQKQGMQVFKSSIIYINF